MEQINEMLKKINENLQGLDNKMNTRFDQVITEIASVKKENVELSKKVEEQGKIIESLEREIRKNNLVIKGIPEEEGEREEDTRNKMMEMAAKIGVKIDQEMQIDDIRRMGRYKPKETRPILLKLTTRQKKMEILKQAKELKGTNIWIDEDYTKKVQEERKALIPHLKEARQHGYKAILRYNKLIINNEVYEIENLQPAKETIEQREEEDKREGKRKVNERSPGDTLDQQERKIIKTGYNPKN